VAPLDHEHEQRTKRGATPMGAAKQADSASPLGLKLDEKVRRSSRQLSGTTATATTGTSARTRTTAAATAAAAAAVSAASLSSKCANPY